MERVHPVAGTTNHKPTDNSAVHPSKMGKSVYRGISEEKSGNSTDLHQLNSCMNTQPKLTNKGKKPKNGSDSMELHDSVATDSSIILWKSLHQSLWY